MATAQVRASKQICLHKPVVAATVFSISCLLTGCGVSGRTSPTADVAGGSVGSGAPTQSPAPPTPAPPSLTVTGPSQVRLDEIAKYRVQAADLATSDVIWSLRNLSGDSSAALGSIASDGTYTAPTLPNSPMTIAVTATSVVDPAVSSTVQVQLLNPIPTISAASFSIQPTASSYQIFVAGAGFASGAQIVVNGAVLTPSSVTPSSIQVSVPASQLPQGTQVGVSATLIVSNPIPAPTSSAPYNVLISGPATSVTAAARLLDQMTFGPTSDSIAHVQSIGLPGAIDEQLQETPELMPPLNWFYGALSPSCMPFYQCVTDGYWAQYAVFGRDQLKQRMAFALSNIWNVSYSTSPVPEFPYLLNAFVRDSTKNYRTLMEDVTLSEAMGTYLNMLNSAAPTNPNQHADENYARELMQLFTLGPNRLDEDGSLILDAQGRPIPTYTQAQVQALAKAFTGWTYANDDCSAPAQFQTISNGAIQGLNCPMSFVPSMHDTTEKSLLNGVILPAGQTPKQDLDQALDSVFEDANLPPFVSRLLIQNLVSSSPSPAYIRRVAEVFKDNGKGVRGDLAAVLKAILLDVEARQGDDPSQTVSGGRLRDPILWTFAVMRALGGTQAGDESAFNELESIEGSMGEQPHSQPSVFGFYSPQFIIPGSALNAPEFELETPTTYLGLNRALDQRFLMPLFTPSNSGADTAVDISANSRLGKLATQGVEPFLEGINTLLYHGRMSQAEQQVLTSSLSGVSTPTDMIKVALYITLISPQFRVIQ